MAEIIPLKESVAVVVVCYNRLDSTKRLLESLKKANYVDGVQVPLVISVDCSGNEELYRYTREFVWNYGPKYTIIHPERLGLKNHIYTCGDLTRYFKGVIILEDDLIVAPDYYNYTENAVKQYYTEPKVAGIALYSNSMYGFAGMPAYYLNDGSDAFMMQATITSGECFTDLMWDRFRNWYNRNEEIDANSFYMPLRIKHYRRAWSKYFNIFLLTTDTFFLHPHLSTTANCGEAGEHGGTVNTIHSPMLIGEKQYVFNSFEKSVKYDIFSNAIGLGKYLGVEDKDLCVDFYGDKMNANKQRYWLSPYQLPYKKIYSFGLVIEPMEANVIYNIAGDDFFVYDTQTVVNTKTVLKFSKRYLSFHFMSFNYKLLVRYSWMVVSRIIENKIKIILRIK